MVYQKYHIFTQSNNSSNNNHIERKRMVVDCSSFRFYKIENSRSGSSRLQSKIWMEAWSEETTRMVNASTVDWLTDWLESSEDALYRCINASSLLREFSDDLLRVLCVMCIVCVCVCGREWENAAAVCRSRKKEKKIHIPVFIICLV